MHFIRRAGECVRIFTFLALGVVAMSAQTSAPAWWAERQVLAPGATADDYAVANVGQLKYFASKAALEMDAKLSPGGAGTAIDDLIFTWTNPPAGAPPADDYAVLNQGQLKYVAKLFYDRLADFDYSGPPLSAGATYPWSEWETDDDDHYAAVNLGQLKYVFSFVPALVTPPVSGDTDSDGLPDAWELLYFPTLAYDGNANPDGDDATNLAEFLQGRNPTKGRLPDVNGAVELSVHRPLVQ